MEKDLEFIWSQRDAKAVFQAAVGHLGGLFTSWDAELFDLTNLESLDNCLGVSLKLRSTGLIINIFNVYGPQSSTRKKALWDNLARIGLATGGPSTIFIGDFNCTRFPSDRLSCVFDAKDEKPFNAKINQSNLLELSLTNARFTWIGPDNKKSKIDRAFVNDVWTNSGQ